MIKEKNLPNGWAIKPMTEVVTWGSGGTPKAQNPNTMIMGIFRG